MQGIRFVSVAILASLLLGLWAGAATAQINVTATLDSATTQTSRLLRNGVASTCGSSRSSPGLVDIGATLAQDTYVVTNSTASSVCYEITLAQPADQLFVVAYLGAFNPGAIQTNYLGDAGSSTTVAKFGVDVPAGATLTVVVHQIATGLGLSGTYNLNIAPLAAPASVPTMTEWALILMSALMAGGAALHLQRRRRLG